MIWDEEFETLPREALEALQLKRLTATVERVYATVPFYRKQFEACGVKPGDLKSLKDLARFPFTTKIDLRDNYPFGLFSAPLEQVVRIHASSGTTGKPTVVGYTRRDINTWSELMARSLSAAGVRKTDIIHNAYGYGLFTGGLGVHYGAEKLGASVIPISGGNTKRQIVIMQDFGSTVLTCTPSYALFLAEMAAEMGVDVKKLKLRVGVFGAEPWSEKMRAEIEKKLPIQALDIYGLSEVIGPGVSIECLEGRRGLHIFEDHFIPEIINPETGESASLRRKRGARLYDHHQGGLSAYPLSDPRHLGPLSGAVPVRKDPCAHGTGERTERRHADHPRGQCFPVPDRKRPDEHRRGRAPLSPDCGPAGKFGHPGRAGGSKREGFFGRDQESPIASAAGSKRRSKTSSA